MPPASSCFNALLKNSRNCKMFFDPLSQKICSFYKIALFQFVCKPLHALLKPLGKLYKPRDYKWQVTVSQPANNFYYKFRGDNVRSCHHCSQTKLKHFWIKYYVDFKFCNVPCKSSAIKWMSRVIDLSSDYVLNFFGQGEILVGRDWLIDCICSVCSWIE